MKYKTGTKIKIFSPMYRWRAKPFANLRGIKNNIASAYRRGRYGWSGQDVWGLDHYLAVIIRDSIRWWLEEANGGTGPVGYPAIPAEHFQALCFADEKESDRAYAEWTLILTQIADGFDAAVTLIQLDYDFKNKEEVANLEEVMRTGLSLFGEHFMSLWD